MFNVSHFISTSKKKSIIWIIYCKVLFNFQYSIHINKFTNESKNNPTICKLIL